jgi:ABC-type transport system involved in multi-copper enzyme maturation permease subunit
MVGSILHQELLLGSRRGRSLVLRRIYTSWLILQFCLFFGRYCYDQYLSMMGTGRPDLAASARFADSYVATLVTQQFLLLFVLAPAFVAGAITDEKSRGTLQYLLTSSLTTGEIVIGKLLGRLAHLALLAVAALPLLCVMAPYSEFDLLSLAGVGVTLLAPLLAVAAASLLASVWAKQTRDAVIAVYVLGMVGYLAAGGIHELAILIPAGSGLYPWVGRLSSTIESLNPLFVLEPAWGGNQQPAEFLRRFVTALVGWGVIAGGCLAAAVWRLRRAYVRQLESVGKKRSVRGWLTRSADEEEPIRWKESQVEGIAPLAVLRRIPRSAAVLAVSGLTFLLSATALTDAVPLRVLLDHLAHADLAGLWSYPSPTRYALVEYFWLQAAVVFLAATAVVGVRCSGAVTGERERQTWEALLLTPLPVRELIRNKVRGIINAARPYLIAFAVPAFILAFLAGGRALFWTVLAVLGAWPAMYFVGAAGIYYSVRSQSSWKSLLATLGFGYVGGLVICTVSIPVVLALSVVVIGMLALLGIFGSISGLWSSYAPMIFVALGWSYILWRIAERFIVDAQRRVIGRERTPYWVSGVNCGYATEEYMKRFESPHA